MQIKPKKRLGQNFLVDKNIRNKIIESIQLRPTDVVLEIGSGRGELTGLIAQNARNVYALEIDSSLCEILENNISAYSNITIINRDILEFNLKAYFKNLKSKIKVVGNIPYYISSPIIEQMFKYRNKIEEIFITVQKEFALRVVALPGSKNFGSLSCFVQYYGKPKIIFSIKNTCFFPTPKVDSCLLKISLRKRPMLKREEEKKFFKIVRAAFNKRRKTMRNSLKGIVLPQDLNQFFTKFKININTRPESLSLENFISLSKM